MAPMTFLLAVLTLLPQDEPAGRRLDLTLGRLFIPERFKPGERVDILVHFHGAARVVEREFARAAKNAVLVTVHVGSGSSVYEKALQDSETLGRLLEETLSKIPGATRGRLWLTSFSAGYGAIRQVLRSGKVEVDGIILADSLHAGYEGGRPRADQMEPFVKFARSGRPLWITHSAIVPEGYASTTETADFLIAALVAERRGADEKNARGMRLVSRADKGGFHVRGYEGTTAAAHMDHLHNLGEFFALLP